MIAMIIPVFKYAKLSIVTQKQKKRHSDKPFIQRYFIDIILLAISLYGLYAYNGQKDVLAQKVLEGRASTAVIFKSHCLSWVWPCGAETDTGNSMDCLSIVAQPRPTPPPVGAQNEEQSGYITLPCDYTGNRCF